MSITPSSTKAGMVLATFRLPREVGAESVYIVGDFNDWSLTSHPMESGDEGFVAQIPLEPGQRHRFRYLLDGVRWENDWAADDYVTNEFGGTDSVLDLTIEDQAATSAPESETVAGDETSAATPRSGPPSTPSTTTRSQQL